MDFSAGLNFLRVKFIKLDLDFNVNKNNPNIEKTCNAFAIPPVSEVIKSTLYSHTVKRMKIHLNGLLSK